MTPTTPEGALTEFGLLAFRLNGRFLEAAERIAAPAGPTAARWQVPGAILAGPKTVAGIARDMGLARQGVQRLADILAAEGLAEYRANPAQEGQAPVHDGGRRGGHRPARRGPAPLGQRHGGRPEARRAARLPRRHPPARGAPVP